jgi:hypothetical protein
MLASLIKFELIYLTRQLSCWFALLMLLFLGYFLSGRQVYHVNVVALSAQNITYALTFLCQVSIFTTSLIAAHFALRDHQHDFYAFVQTKPITNFKLTLSRFIALFVMSLTLVTSASVSMLLPLLLSEYDPDVSGRFELINLLWPLLVIVLPNILFISTILYVSASLSKSSIMTFVAGVGIYVLYMMSAALLDSPMFVASNPIERNEINLASLFDPFSIAAFLEQSKLLTTEQLNTHLVQLEGSFLYNRLVWLGVSVLLLTVVIKISRYKGDSEKVVDKKRKKKSVQPPEVTTSNIPAYKPVSPVFDTWLAFRASYLLELRMAIKSTPFVLLMLLVLGLSLAQIIHGLNYNALVGEQLPYTSTMLAFVSTPLEMIGVFIVIFFTGELFWRSREQNFDAFLNVTPTPVFIFYLAKVAVMACIIVLLVCALILLVLGYQSMKGFYDYELSLLFSLFPLFGLPLLLMAILGMAIQSLVSNKYTGFAIVGAILLFFQSDMTKLVGIEHYLFRFAQTAPQFYSDFDGYDFSFLNTFWFSLYWTLITVFIAVVAYGISQRTKRQATFSGVSRLKGILVKKKTKAALLLFIAVLSCASFIFYNTHVLNHYQSSKDNEQLQVHYEKELAFYKLNASPKINKVDVDVAFYPSQRQVTISGEYQLINPSLEPINQFLVTIPHRDQNIKLNIGRQYHTNINSKLNVIEVFLTEPLNSGEKLKLGFTTQLVKQGFKNEDRDISLLKNGSYFHGSHLLPYIGYNASFELRDTQSRTSHQLPERKFLSKLIEGKKYHEHGHNSDASWISYQATVSTEKGQTPIAAGVLQRTWEQNDRNYAEYKVGHNISHFLGFASANYQTKTHMAGGVKLTVYYHAGHSTNIKKMLDTVAKSLEYFQQAYGPYPLPELNLVEIPSRGFGRAYPGTIFISENVGFKENLAPGTGVDNFSYLLAHEVAHQWWGHQLAAAKTEGEVLLIESLADFSALMVMKDIYGEEYVEQIVSKSSNQYLKNRSRDTLGETPLYKMLGQRYLRYHKGPVVLNAIRHLIGEKALNNALKQLLDNKGNVTSHYATSLHLIAVIKKNAKASDHKLIDEWLTQIVTYDLAIEDASLTKLKNGHYQITASLTGHQISHDSPNNSEQKVFSHDVEVAAYEASGDIITLSREWVNFKSSKQNLIFTTPVKPALLVLDPKFMFIDKNRLDNRIRFDSK